MTAESAVKRASEQCKLPHAEAEEARKNSLSAPFLFSFQSVIQGRLISVTAFILQAIQTAGHDYKIPLG